VPDLSRAILDLREGHEGFAIQQKWFGDATPSLDFDYGGRDTDSARLSLKSFAGLFIINGFVLVIVLVALIKIILAYRNHSHVINGETFGDEEQEPLQNDMATDSVPAESLQVETIGDIGHQQLQNGLAIDSVPAESLEVETRTS
jgi:glutamate receptor, ionotropic, plant